MADSTTLFRARVPTARLKRVEKILAKAGLKPGDAVNIFLAQVELRKGIPFPVTAEPQQALAAEEQAAIWNNHFGAY
jgi:antitoxin component of RelBE/YafQ-DinJ toxin-antitoxin module